MLSGVHTDDIICPVVRKNISQIEVENPGNSRMPVSEYPYPRIDYDALDNLDKIAHDIRGSINVIIGYAQIMLDGASGKINMAQREALQNILTYGNRLCDLTSNILKQLETKSGKK
jgi:hypothetical protein